MQKVNKYVHQQFQGTLFIKKNSKKLYHALSNLQFVAELYHVIVMQINQGFHPKPLPFHTSYNEIQSTQES